MADNDRKELDSLIKKHPKLFGASLYDSYLKMAGDEKAKILIMREQIDLQAKLDDEIAEHVKTKSDHAKTKSNYAKLSVEQAYGKTHKNFKQPRLAINKSVIPSVKGNKRKLKTKDEEGNDMNPEPLSIPKANIMPCSAGTWANIEDVTIPTLHADGELIGSLLAVLLDNTGSLKELEYSNEFEVQTFCSSMISDALKALGLTTDYVKPHLEISMYTMKPDIVLVLRREGRIFFVVEVKSPERPEDDTPAKQVFYNSHVGGQIWSYLYAMKAMGDEQPMGAIMTYKKIALVTLEDLPKYNSHLARVQKTQEVLKSGFCPEVVVASDIESKCLGRFMSPVKTIELKKDVMQVHDQNMTDELSKEIAMERNVYSSRVYEEREVFPCLLQALHIAYQKTTDASCEKLPVVRHGDQLGRRLVFKLSRCGFDWVKTPQLHKGEPFSSSHTLALPPRSDNYYVLGKLGEGSTAAVFLICNTSGKLCSMKDYFLKPSQEPNPSRRNEEENDSRALLYEEACKEAGMWRVLYPNRFDSRPIYLGGSPCILMPYGHEIEEEKRGFYISDVKDQLEKFAEKGYKYNFSDLRWRHALLDAKREVFLCDLASLEEKDKAETTEVVVFDQLEVLSRRLVTEEQKEATLARLGTNTKHTIQSMMEESFDGLISKDELDKVSKELEECRDFTKLSAQAKVCVCVISWVEAKGDGEDSSPSKDSSSTGKSPTSVPSLESNEETTSTAKDPFPTSDPSLGPANGKSSTTRKRRQGASDQSRKRSNRVA